MYNIFKISFLYIFLFLLPKFTFSQDPPIEWGEIPRVDLEMKSYPQDTNATALILCDYGVSHINDEFNVEYSRIMRVKILNSNGFSWGSNSIEILTKDGVERVYDIEGITYNLDENGKVVESELDDDDIFKEEVDDRSTSYRFTLPNLKPGCVVEIKYKIEAKSLFLVPDWTFQYSEPVLWSEYRVIFPHNIIYSGVFGGYEPWYYNNIDEVDETFNDPAASMLGGHIVKCHQYRYVVKDAPAIRKEPYITTVDDYFNKVNIQLAGYSFIGTGKKDVLRTWNSLVSDLVDDDAFLNRIDVTGDIEELAAKITKGLTSPEEKLKAIYNWVSKSIVWNGENGKYAKNEVDDILELKKGNDAEITFLLLSLLKSAGIHGDPVILSTRSNGKIQELYPIIFQFNYDIARVVIGNKTYYLDATNPNRPMDILPSKILGVRGLVIKEGDDDTPVEWVSFSTDKKNINKTLINTHINPDGSLSGIIEDVYGEYKSLSIREDMSSKKDIDIAKELYDPESEGFTIDSVSIENKDSLDLPIKVKSSISSSIYAQKSGDLIYINPFMVHRLKENPLKTKIRRFPVDYAYKSSQVVVINLALPEGYELKESLAKKAYYEGNDASYSRQMMVEDNRIQIINKIDLKNTIVNPREYDKLRNFYAQIVSAESEQLVIGPKENKVNSQNDIQPASGKVSVGNK